MRKAINDILREDIEIPLTREPPTGLIDDPEHGVTCVLLQKGPKWLFEFFNSSFGDRRLQREGISLDRSDPSYCWPADEELDFVIGFEDDDLVPLGLLNPSQPVPFPFKAPSFDKYAGSPYASGLGRTVFPRVLLREMIPATGFTLWDGERLASFGNCLPEKLASLDPSDTSNMVYLSAEAIPISATILGTVKGDDWPTPFEEKNAPFEASLESRWTLAEHGHTGHFDYEAFKLHHRQDMLIQSTSIDWCLAHYHRDMACAKCSERFHTRA